MNTIGRYEIQYKVGSGTFGDVYKAYDPVLKRVVAIKMPSMTLDREKLADVVKEFYHEAAVGAQFQHKNIITVYDVGCNTVGESSGSDDFKFHYLVMEFVSGVNLKEYLEQEKQLSIRETLNIVFECCKALDYIHFQGVLHRDIKPGNIMVNPNYSTVKITDFSISDSVTNQMDKTIGTLPYTSPEHFLKDKPLSIQTDIFALGSVMYQLLTGKSPFRGSNVDEIVNKIVNADPVPVQQFRPDVPSEVEEIVVKAMQKKPEDRFSSALDFADAVSKALMGFPEEAEAAGGEEKKPKTNISEYMLLRQNSWFIDFSPNQIDELVSSGEVLTFEAEEDIVTEGEEANAFFTILEGEADVVKGAITIGHLQAGECFGELGHLTADQKRTASIIATEPVRVLKVDSELLSKLSPESQAAFYKAFLIVTMKRLVDKSEELASKSC
ncbi:MAG: cyclic nucleotide-binding domain-containing protein [Gammaproteobacteria bacterium]|nr:MAG: cyclic nucleotide-binding domain-containing protein [Gammaproteobacteria bacterium]